MSETGQCIQIDHQNTTICVVLLNDDHPAYLCGTNIVNVKAIRGTVRILGYDLSPDMPPVPAYSFKAFNSLRVIPVKEGSTEEDTPYLESLHLPADVMEKALCYSYLFVATKCEESDGFFGFLRNSTDLPRFVQTDTNDSRMVTLFPTANDNPLLEDKVWDERADEFVLKSQRRTKKIILCGGAKVGKSTLMRYLINRHLGRWKRVLVIDLDPGQSEFTVMGCLSAVLVDQPLLGPNFSHFIVPEKSVYLGNINVFLCHVQYAECVERLVNFCNSIKYKDIPWIINTIGCVKGVGLALLAGIMEGIKPTDIVQIMSGKYKENFSSTLTPSFFNLQELKLDGGERWEPRLHQLPSLAEKASSSCVNPSIKRDLVTMSYLRRAMRSEETDLLNVTPKKIETNDVEIVIVESRQGKEIQLTTTTAEKLSLINHNLVALCSGNSLSPLDCLGFGVVQGFDLETGFIHLITPVLEEVLKRVTVIKMSPTVRLPRKLNENHDIKKK